jgi:hypothetical protein
MCKDCKKCLQDPEYICKAVEKPINTKKKKVKTN